MDVLFLILSLVCAVIGLIGAVLPILPGPPLSFVALLIISFADRMNLPVWFLVITGILALVITLFDYFAPVWLTNKKGGSRYGVYGATIGLLIGFFFGLPGIILGPFIGALIGELIAKTPMDKAFKVAFMSFVAFMLTTGIKLIYCLVVMIIVIYNSFVYYL